MSVKAYLAHKMTGRTGEALCAESAVAYGACHLYGVTPLDPVVVEGVQPTRRKIKGGTPEALKVLWKRDKELIREAHVLIDLTGDMHSEGVLHEIGYARYYLWKPVVRVQHCHVPGSSISDFEDDAIVGSFSEAAALVHARWGTWQKRCLWRARMLPKALFKWAWHQTLAWR